MTYHRPMDLGEALEIRAAGPVRVLAGGTDIFPPTAARDLPDDMLDLTAIEALRGISRTPQGWRIGAMTRWSDLENADLPAAFDALKQAGRQVGSVQIQNSATIGGNICNASPAADGVPPLLVLDGQVEILSARGRRLIPLANYITGVRQIALAPHEIVAAIHIPASAARGASAFAKLGARHYLVISIAMVAVRLEVTAGLIGAALVAVGACGPVARRLGGLESALVGCNPRRPAPWQEALKRDVEGLLSPIDDIRADAAYRQKAVAELVTETIGKAARA